MTNNPYKNHKKEKMFTAASACRKSNIFSAKGFTLVEILLYFTIVGVVTFTAISFAIQIVKVNSLSGNYRELQANADFIEREIDIAVKSATSVDDANSIFNEDEGILSLQMEDFQVSPTQFYLVEGDIFVKRGGEEPLKLNSQRVEAEFLKFSKYEYPKTPDQINVEAKLAPKNGDIAGIDKKINLYLTSSLRKYE